MKVDKTVNSTTSEAQAYRAPRVRDNGSVVCLTKDHPAYGDPEMFDFTMVWGS
jgi:hypothetical protein